jgi:hypothetical protein
MCRKLIYPISFVLLLGLISDASAELVGQWKLDEGAGTTALDASGNGNNGTLEDDPTVVDGQFVQALAFEGSRVAIPASDTLTADLFQGSFTLSAWINPKRTGNTWQQIFRSMIAADTSNDTLFINNDGRLSWRGRVGGAWAGGMCETAAGVVPADQWTHVAVTGDGTNFRIYVNGALSQESAFQTTDGSNATYYIGGDPPTTGESYTGIVDDLRVYNHVLSQDDIRLSMENQGGAIVKAYGPNPRNDTLHEDTWINLSWRAGDFAASHDVYLGNNFDDVNNGAADTFQGNQDATFFVAGFPGFPYPDGLVPGTTYYWRIDEVNDTEPNSPWKGDVWSFWIPPKKAYEPNPADSVKFVNTDVELSWTAGFGSKLHTVYFGENFDDVNNAAGGLPQGAATYDPGTLELDKDYYWRVDEFDGVVTHKGDTWSFRTLPEIPITEPNLIGWWTLDEGMGATALDWSGHDNHGTLINGPQWVTGYNGGALEFDGNDDAVTFGTGPALSGTTDLSVAAWIKTSKTSAGVIIQQRNGGYNGEYRFMVNGSGQLSLMLYGDGDYQYDFSTTKTVNDGNWHHAVFVRQDSSGYIYIDGNFEASDSGILRNLDSTIQVAVGADVRDSINYFSGIIDDVRIYNKALTQEEIELTMRGDPLLAWGSKPGNGSTPYIRDAAPLSWSAGDNASEHDVYFGTDRDAVADADETDTTGIYRGRQGVSSYNPPEGVEWGGGPYYWRVDEYNTDATISKGNVWSFTVADFILVDDFEDYDVGNNEIWWAWIDGLGYASHPTLPSHPGNGTGSIVGDETTGSYMEETIVHGGGKSMPVFYDNNQQAKFRYSEVEKTLSSRRDWTEEGVGVLSIWFQGVASNTAESLYVALNGNAVVTHDNPNAAQIEAWTEWTIDLQAFADQGVNLANVNTIALGLGNKKNPVAGGSGTMYFDDIRLYRPPPTE